jgi:hypothetical protein
MYTTAKLTNPEVDALIKAFNGVVTVCKRGKSFKTFRQRGTWEAMAARNGATTFVTQAQRASNYNPNIRG